MADNDGSPAPINPLGAADNPEVRKMVEQLQAQMQARLTAEANEFLKSLPESVQGAVTELKGLQAQRDELDEQYRKERAELEAKYRKLYAPLYEERAAIVAGTSGVSAEADPKGIPKFWLTALRHHPMIQAQITEKDAEVLEYMTDLTSKPLEGDAKGFELSFHFRDNPFFTNSVLTKRYAMVDEDEPILERIEGTDISWKPGKNVTVKVMKKKPKRAGQKPLTKNEPCESFFNFFSPPELPENEEEIDHDELDDIQSAMEEDYDVGTLLRDKIIAQAVLWFTGEAVTIEDLYDEEEEEDDEDYEDEDTEGEDDEDEDEDDEDEDEDEDDNDEAAKRMNMPGGKEGEQPPECKQQ